MLNLVLAFVLLAACSVSFCNSLLVLVIFVLFENRLVQQRYSGGLKRYRQRIFLVQFIFRTISSGRTYRMRLGKRFSLVRIFMRKSTRKTMRIGMSFINVCSIDHFVHDDQVNRQKSFVK